VSLTDLSHRLVPRRLVYGGTALIVPLLVITAAVDHRWHSLVGSAVAGAVAFGFFFAVWWFVPRGMGYGDVRLAGIIGLTVGYLSLLHAYVAFLVGFIVGMVFGLGLMALSSAGRKTRIPFAPSLAIGAVVAVLWGGSIAQGIFHAGH
jgi:leader peptidase (prepilin peptidase)/N-methyltransferase